MADETCAFTRRYAVRMSRWRIALLGVVVLAIPLLVSQLLPSDNPDRWSPIAVGLLVGIGALGGFVWPTVRGWLAIVVAAVIGSALILLTWTDLVLDVFPSVLPADTWRNETVVAIVGALALVSVGFLGGALLARRGRPRIDARDLPLVAATVAGALVGAFVVATVFAGTSIVVRPGDGTVTVVVSDSGLQVQPATLGTRSYRVLIENRASRPMVVSAVTPVNLADGMTRAMTAAEIAAWQAGSWEALGEPFRQAFSSRVVPAGGRVYGGFLQVQPAPDATGGVLWYASEDGAVRTWPGVSEDPESGDSTVPWPAVVDTVQPVAAS